MLSAQLIKQFLSDIELLQEQLMELNDDSLDLIKENFFQMIYKNIKDDIDDNYRNMFFKSLAFHLIIASKMRPTKIKLLVDIIVSTFSREEIVNSKKIVFYKTIILTTIFNSIKNNLNLSSQCTIVCLLHHFVVNDFFKMSQILTLYKNEKVTQNKGKKAIFTIFFCWFAPLIEREDKKLFCEMNENIFHFHDDINFGYSFKLFFDNIHKLKENDWDLFNHYIKIEQNFGTVNEAIKNNDNDNYIRELSANPNFKFSLTPEEDIKNRNGSDMIPSSIIEPSLFEPSWIVQNRPTFIQFAAYFGSLKCFKYILLSMKMQTSNTTSFLEDIEDEKKRNLIMFAIAGGNIEIVRLCEQNGIDLGNSLSIATEYYQHDIFLWIIESYKLDEKLNESNVNDELFDSQKQLTDIFCSAASSNNIYIMKWCINEKHVDINRKNENGMNPLLLAAENGSYESFLLILNNCHNVDINITDDKYNKNALHYACEHNHSEIVELLMTFNGKKINCVAPGFRMMNAFCLACKNGCVSCVRILLRYIPEDDLDMLLNSHAEISLATPLHLACWHGHKDIVNILIHEEKVDIISLMDDNRTPLHIAAENRHSEIVSLLVNKEKFLINMKDKGGYTALHLAACNNDIETVNVLLSTGLCNVELYEKIIFSYFHRISLIFFFKKMEFHLI